MKCLENLPLGRQGIVRSVKTHAESLMSGSSRFKYFTLHGEKHINSLFGILDTLIEGGLILTSDEIYLLSLAICTHDLGMVVGLKEQEIIILFGGKPGSSDPAIVEEEIRERHHEMVDIYISKNFSLLSALGVTPADLATISEIAKCHRKTNLSTKRGTIQKLGALIRVIDELDISPDRAPIAALMNEYEQMDSTSLWHWLKHNIVRNWSSNENVAFKDQHGRKSITFHLAVYPSKSESIPYWLHQISRPIQRVLKDQGCSQMVKDLCGITIDLKQDHVGSVPSPAGQVFADIEAKALSGGRQVIMLIDDEVRIMEDLMLKLSLTHQVIYASSAKDAFDKMAATKVDLAIVDMQIGGTGVWSPSETNDYKSTGVNILKKIREEYPQTKLAILSGTKHDIPLEAAQMADLFMRKPILPSVFNKRILDVLKN